jgi:hypothetical protein
MPCEYTRETEPPQASRCAIAGALLGHREDGGSTSSPPEELFIGGWCQIASKKPWVLPHFDTVGELARCLENPGFLTPQASHVTQTPADRPRAGIRQQYQTCGRASLKPVECRRMWGCTRKPRPASDPARATIFRNAQGEHGHHLVLGLAKGDADSRRPGTGDSSAPRDGPGRHPLRSGYGTRHDRTEGNDSRPVCLAADYELMEVASKKGRLFNGSRRPKNRDPVLRFVDGIGANGTAHETRLTCRPSSSRPP